MTVRMKDLVSLILQIFLLIIVSSLTIRNSQINPNLTLVEISRIGTIVAIILWGLIIWVTGGVFSNISFIYLSFVLFQFGIPILYATTSNYINDYMSLFSLSTIISGATFTVFCIQLFSLGIQSYLIFNSQKERSLIFAKTQWAQDDSLVEEAAIILFAVSAAIYLPATLYGAIVLRSRFSLPAIGGLAKQFFFPAAFLILCYTKRPRVRRIVYCLFFIEAVAGLFTGGRTEGLLPLMVFVVYYSEYRTKGDRAPLRKKGLLQRVPLILSLVIITVLLIFIAQVRVGNSVSSSNFSLENIYESFVGELGFNFTTILFVMTGIGLAGFQYGMSYINDIVALYPSALDPTGIVLKMQESLGSTWIQNTYGNSLGFGLGFSIIGEAYYNFGYYGGFFIFLFEILIAALQHKSPAKSTNWEKYLEIALLLGFMTIPRRDFYQFLKQIEYSVFVMSFYLYACWKLSKHGRNSK